MVAPGEVGIDGLEASDVVLPIIRRQFHSGQDDRGSGLSQLLNDPTEVTLRLFEAEPSEPVIPAQLKNDHVEFAAEHPWNTAEAAGGRLATDARVDHPITIIELIEPAL